MPAGRSATAGLRVPRLDGIARQASTGDAQQLPRRLACAMLDAGVAHPEMWEGHVSEFIRVALSAWVQSHGGDIVDRRLELVAFIQPELDPYYNEHLLSGKSDDVVDRCFLCLDPSAAGNLHLGPAIDWLERVHPRLPATLVRGLDAAGHVIRCYTHFEAEEYFLMRSDGVDEEDLEELEHPAREIPKALSRKPLGDRAIARLRRGWPSDVCAVVDRAREVERLGKTFGRIRPDAWTRDDVVHDMGIPVPGLVCAFEEHDFIHAAFDDESQYMLELAPEPNRWWMIEDAAVDDVRAAFDSLGKGLEVLAAMVQLMELLPDRRDVVVPVRVRSRCGRPLVQVLAGPDVEAA